MGSVKKFFTASTNEKPFLMMSIFLWFRWSVPNCELLCSCESFLPDDNGFSADFDPGTSGIPYYSMAAFAQLHNGKDYLKKENVIQLPIHMAMFL